VKIAIFTTTRAEYGLLRWIIKEFAENQNLSLNVIAGGTHLSIADGYTFQELVEDGLENITELPFLTACRRQNALVSSIGIGLIQISEVFNFVKPDYSIILGDRYELFILAIASMMFNIPIIHLCGGERTEGLIDEQVRHAITKMAHIHMPSTEFYAENISKMGEEDWRIHIVGAPGLENIRKLKLYTKEEIFKITNINLNNPTIICTYHPVTLEGEESVDWQIENLLVALTKFDLQIIFTRPNAEVGSDRIVEMIKEFVDKNEKAYFFDSLGTKLYLSILKYSKAVVGNSSSGIIEAPSFGVPTINIGNRQKGRLKPESVIQVGYSTNEIAEGLKKALFDSEFLHKIKHLKNPYGDGNTSKYVIEAINEIVKIPKEKLLKKKLNFEVNKNEWHKYF
jgi:GDP/UDP-N,N'-diacetylbacillosamine 2-epimerase (hydrolysing)